ncbi:Coatomer subunit alpha [Dissostichus eleginoides]|uniref:Coatomer subunit alpha n=1 Tax=Dissostichus eleginoides TaxID=100907 RepID=A0AAD9C1H4_DISEL|nr:Coatomer subunit alpha [Dissostichus eleginoides]
MRGTDRCRTKGAVVYCYIPSLLPSLHPPLPCLPLRETGPFLLQSSRRCVADRKVMAQEKGGAASAPLGNRPIGWESAALTLNPEYEGLAKGQRRG